ncbi:LppX_LprAFG lipoprotein [Geodermatophilus marinus]|uniref:LppX_LprAFG lipoprotein n=1 Tax=Geodermatophilus sp. LHW52908 TaxID=2303986 RepID=UPI000E3DA177|nr:LppX_LprAFG lipoprotein [Geodermatophilus sp. LHW52908]RFU20036.1 LppX_LprAFG lipoprotein [Geodermatophilus sp. LHW52908]
MPRNRAVAVLVAGLLLAAPAGCGSDEPAVTAEGLLEQARATLDGADSVHFVLTSEGASGAGTALVGGEGDIARPASFSGTLQVRTAGTTVDLPVVSVDGTVWAELPFTSGFTEVDPAEFGVGDPGALLDPDTGITRLLAGAEDAELGEERRVEGAVVREVTATLPGDLVEQVLATQDPQRPVDARLSIDPETGELRSAELVGPFFSAEGEDGVYTLELSGYGTDVDITAPPTG